MFLVAASLGLPVDFSSFAACIAFGLLGVGAAGAARAGDTDVAGETGWAVGPIGAALVSGGRKGRPAGETGTGAAAVALSSGGMGLTGPVTGAMDAAGEDAA